jgi:hypothetical protein
MFWIAHWLINIKSKKYQMVDNLSSLQVVLLFRWSDVLLACRLIMTVLTAASCGSLSSPAWGPQITPRRTMASCPQTQTHKKQNKRFHRYLIKQRLVILCTKGLSHKPHRNGFLSRLCWTLLNESTIVAYQQSILPDDEFTNFY